MLERGEQRFGRGFTGDELEVVFWNNNVVAIGRARNLSAI
jgi:hypothetical protein